MVHSLQFFVAKPVKTSVPYLPIIMPHIPPFSAKKLQRGLNLMNSLFNQSQILLGRPIFKESAKQIYGAIFDSNVRESLFLSSGLCQKFFITRIREVCGVVGFGKALSWHAGLL